MQSLGSRDVFGLVVAVLLAVTLIYLASITTDRIVERAQCTTHQYQCYTDSECEQEEEQYCHAE